MYKRQTLINRVGVDGLVGGQVVDIQHEGIEEIDLPTVDYIHAHKTGSMIDAAVVTGAIIGGASEDVIARMSRYARKIGIAFQIIDDVLDGTASQQQLGKTPNKDERAHKATYPRLVGIAESTRRARELVDSAKKELDSFGDRATLLLAIADHICTRKS